MTISNIALLPCPFCGGKAEIERPGTARQSCIIACADCGCRLETGEVWSMGERWNRRHALTATEPQSAEVREALELAEDVLSRAPFSTAVWPNGMHPNTGIEKIRAALALTRPKL